MSAKPTSWGAAPVDVGQASTTPAADELGTAPVDVGQALDHPGRPTSLGTARRSASAPLSDGASGHLR